MTVQKNLFIRVNFWIKENFRYNQTSPISGDQNYSVDSFVITGQLTIMQIAKYRTKKKKKKKLAQRKKLFRQNLSPNGPFTQLSAIWAYWLIECWINWHWQLKNFQKSRQLQMVLHRFSRKKNSLIVEYCAPGKSAIYLSGKKFVQSEMFPKWLTPETMLKL